MDEFAILKVNMRLTNSIILKRTDDIDLLVLFMSNNSNFFFLIQILYFIILYILNL